MLERLIILIGLALLIAAGWGVLRLWRGWKLRQLRGAAPLATVAPLGRPAVIAFSTPSCAECKSLQAPALSRLNAALGESITVRHNEDRRLTSAGFVFHNVPAWSKNACHFRRAEVSQRLITNC